MKAFWRDENGFVVSAELILVATIVVLGLVVGLAEVRQAISEELEDVASAFGSVNQSYNYIGLSTSKAQTSGSGFSDQADLCDSQFDIGGVASQDEGGGSGGSGGGGSGGGGNGGGNGGGSGHGHGNGNGNGHGNGNGNGHGHDD